MQPKAKKKFSISYFVAFITAICSLSWFFNAPKQFEVGNDLLGNFMMLGGIGIFVLSMIFMSYRIYKEEKIADNLKTRVALFEWFYRLEEANNSKQNLGSEV